jgi:succinyl-CoA---D-citramalate CoA-transferase
MATLHDVAARLAGGALDDLRVIEVGQLVAGPFCGQLMADFGAEVIKVEPPGEGDPMRNWGREKSGGLSLWWPIVARNKKSVTLDLHKPDGQRLLRELVATADVLIENMRPGTLEKWGLGYEDLSAVNPRLVMIRVTGFGQDGPYSSQPGYGSIGEAMGGLRYVMGEPDRPPARAGISIGDTIAALFACIGGLMALHARERTGRGQVVDAALYESVLAVMESLISEYDTTGYIRERTGGVLPNIAPSNAYPTADGLMILVAANQDTVFRRLCDAMGRPELATNAHFATHLARGDNQQELDDLIAAWTATLDAQTLREILVAHSVPNGWIYRAPEMLADPHFAARDAIVRVHHPELGELAMQNVAPRLSATPGAIQWVGPELGAHNDEIFGTVLGLSARERETLRAAGVI